jgi:hypothetical protein
MSVPRLTGILAVFMMRPPSILAAFVVASLVVFSIQDARLLASCQTKVSAAECRIKLYGR